MGCDALTTAVASTSRWDAADYASVGGFVAELGQAALDLLDPQPGERVLPGDIREEGIGPVWIAHPQCHEAKPHCGVEIAAAERQRLAEPSGSLLNRVAAPGFPATRRRPA